MKDMSQSLEKKSFFILAAYTAENATDQFIVDRLTASIEKYKAAQGRGVNQKRLDSIFEEITVLSYVNVLRMLSKPADHLIRDMQDVDRVLDLIKPNTN